MAECREEETCGCRDQEGSEGVDVGRSARCIADLEIIVEKSSSHKECACANEMGVDVDCS